MKETASCSEHTVKIITDHKILGVAKNTVIISFDVGVFLLSFESHDSVLAISVKRVSVV